MPLSKRVIPCLDVSGGRVVKGTNFRGLRDAGDPVELASRYRDEGADEIVFLDITASSEGRGTLTETVRGIADVMDIPFTVGGGVRSVDDMQMLLRSGADKVTVNTAAVARPELLGEMAAVFGRQSTVLAIDAKRAGNGRYTVFVNGGRDDTGRDAVAWAREAAERGIGEILLTSIDRDGTKDGYDLELVRAVAESVNVPVIASGGCGSAVHMADVLAGAADAALAASIFHYDAEAIGAVKRILRERGIHVRI
ncbi:MAG: imidazole glycerol phosphate synthase subunit HisF [Nitrosopumilus sp.]|nr:imidazole glycerol phosphate synthase subunit HisF [Nitrosopumilus sp.]MDA7958944.1 imidazole glycerol phosphate synthase subunit HisF [Nitrosopumilus sp.]